MNLCFTNALKKSCFHQAQVSFDAQVSRLRLAEYPEHLLTSVAGALLKKLKIEGGANAVIIPKEKRNKVAVVPYLHRVSHGLKKIGKRVDVTVVFSAPNKLSKLCRNVNHSNGGSLGCTKKHQNRFVECTEKVVYSIPLSCGKQYVGQTGRCLNDRLREHSYNVNRVVSGHLGIHCRDCGCDADFKKCIVIGRSVNALTREIMEAEMIARLGEDCVSAPSVFLSAKELDFLSRRQHAR